MTFHGEDRKALHKVFGAAILPEELGGLLGNIDELSEVNMFVKFFSIFII